MSINAILFDFYGTLIERQKKHFIKLISHNHLQRLKTEERPLSLAALLLNVQQKLMTCDLSSHKIPHDILSLVAAPRAYHDRSAIEHTLRESMQQEAESTILFPGVKTLLGFLQRRGFRLGLVSNVSTYHKAPFYRFGLERFMDTAVFSCDVGSIKPQKGIYLKACRELGVTPEETLFVGDSYKSDVLAPRSLGMQALHVAHFKKTPQNVEQISELGLVLFSKGLPHLKHCINELPALSKREITLREFTLIDTQETWSIYYTIAREPMQGQTVNFTCAVLRQLLEMSIGKASHCSSGSCPKRSNSASTIRLQKGVITNKKHRQFQFKLD